MTEEEYGPSGDAAGAALLVRSGADVQDEAGDALDDLVAYLDVVFGDGIGYASVALGMTPRVTESGSYQTDLASNQQVFEWPFDAEKALEWMSGADCDVFVCPYLLTGTKRTKGASEASSRLHVHADVDFKGDGALEVDAVKLIPGAIAVESGSPGNAHVYVLLTESVSLPNHERLCRALGARCGTKDTSKVSDNDLLRPPGTCNYKPTVMDGGGRPPSPVRWLVRPSGRRCSPRELAELLGVELVESQEVDVAVPPLMASPPVGSEVREVPYLDVRYPGVCEALERVTEDRSAETMRIVSTCRAAGLTLPETRWVVASRPDLVERLDERHDDDVARCWGRAGGDEIVDGDRRGSAKLLYTDVDSMLDGSLPPSPKPDVLHRTDDAALFYRSEVNMVFGDPEHGKTWVVLAACAEALKNGERVLVADLDHNGPSATINRLVLLGAPEEALRDQSTFRHCQPAEVADVKQMVEDCKRWCPDLVVVDSTGELLPLFKANSDNADDFTRVHNAVLQPLADTGAAVLLVDHLAKNRASRDYGPGGSMAKRRTVGGCSIRVVRERAYTLSDGGASALWVNKDRHGGVRERSTPAASGKDEQLVGTFLLSSIGGAGGVSWQVLPGPSTATQSGEAAKFRPTALMERASREVERAPGKLTKNKLALAVGGRKASTLFGIDVLEKEGFIKCERQGRYDYYVPITPYRESEDLTGQVAAAEQSNEHTHD
ncbi:AAA family ATPase [Mycolicibacterium sp. 3033]|nr:AAA family ATPase [Mycolicibacterium aurantiacum]